MPVEFILAFLVSCAALSAQACAVIVPGTSTPIATTTPAQVSLTLSGYATASKGVLWFDNVRYGTVFVQDPGTTTPADPKVPFLAPWTTAFPPAIFGDGPHAVYAQIFDALTNEVTGTPLCTTPTVNFTVRSMGMSNQSIVTSVTNTAGQLNVLTFNAAGNTQGGALYLDGQQVPQLCGSSGITSVSGGWGTASFDPACYTTGVPHLIMATTNMGSFTDPVMVTDSFAGSVSGASVTINNHYHWQGSAVTFTTTGTVPTPLTLGAQYWGTASVAVAGGQIQVTLPSSPAITIGTSTRVFLRNMKVNPQLGQACDGYYSSIATVTSQTVFALTAPATCPNGIVSGSQTEIILEPWFAVYGGVNTVGFSQTAALNSNGDVLPGSAATLSGGSGTHTATQRLRSSGYGYGDAINQAAVSINNFYGPNYVQKLVTFTTPANTPMEIEPQYSTIFNSPGNTDTLSWQIKNTDLSFTAKNCSSSGVTCNYSDLGTPTGQITWNSSTQVITYVAKGSWTNPNTSPIAWGKIVITCNSTCAGNAHGLQPVTVLVENCGGACTTPHFGRNGQIQTTFTPNVSFFPLSAGAEVSPQDQSLTGWAVAAFKNAFLNSAYGGGFVDNNLTMLHVTTPQSWPSSEMLAAEAFATATNSSLKLDLEMYFVGAGANKPAVFGAIMGNLGFNRQANLQTLAAHLTSSGKYFAAGVDDESSFLFHNWWIPDVRLGGASWSSVTVSGCPGACVADFAVKNVNAPTAWNQSAGTGIAFRVAGATNTFLNNIFLPSSVSATDWIAPCTGGCSNGPYNVGTDASAKLVLNQLNAQQFQNVAALPNESYNQCISWSSVSCGGLYAVDSFPAASSNLTSIVVSGSTATINWTGVGSEFSSTIPVRIWGSVNGLNIVCNATVSANSLSCPYPGGTGGTAPAANTYNLGNDPGVYITVDPNLPANAVGTFFSLFNSGGGPITNFTTLGALFNVNTPGSTAGLVSYEGYPNAQSAMEYNSAGAAVSVLGVGATINDAANLCLSEACGLLPWQAQPAQVLIPTGHQYVPYSQNLGFNPATDRSTGLEWRPELIQTYGRSASALGVVGIQMYTFNTALATWHGDCCGLVAPGTSGAPISTMTPYTGTIMYNGLTVANVTYRQSERWEFGAPCNHQYFGPLFFIDCHQSATRGNEVSVLCTSEMPYSQFPINTLAISGGTLWLRQADGNTVWWSKITGTPSTLTREWCLAPGLQSSIIAEPPGLEAVDTVTFPAIDSHAPAGATKKLVRVTYSVYDALDNPAVDCTAGCSISIDHHNAFASYQILYTDNNYQAVGLFNPQLLTEVTQGQP